MNDWQLFLKDEIVKNFDGFNFVDSVGFYKGKPEQSKIVTFIVNENEMSKVEMLARSYAKKFHQESVMMVKVAVSQWDFIEADEKVMLNQDIKK